MSLDKVVLELVTSVEAILAPTATIKSRTPEDLVVVLHHVALELVVALIDGDACAAQHGTAQCSI